MDFTARARLPLPPTDVGAVLVDRPPAVPKPTPVSPLARLVPIAMIAATIGMVALYLTTGAAKANPMFAVFPVMMLASAVGSLAYGARGTHRTAELDEHRRDYLHYLDELEDALDDAARTQGVAARWCHPDPRALWTLVGTARMWERRPGDADFGHVRVGLGDQPAVRAPVAPELPSSEPVDPVVDEALHRLLRDRATLAMVPVTVDLFSGVVVVVSGDVDAARALVRALLCQLVVMHGPMAAAIAAVVDVEGAAAWDWLKWLPHHRLPGVVDAAGPARRTHRRLDAIEPGDMAGALHTVVIVDGGVPSAERPEAGPTIVVIGELPHGWDTTSAVHVDAAGTGFPAAPDAMTERAAVVCARRLARFHEVGREPSGRHPADEWSDLIGLDPRHLDPQHWWRPRSPRHRLCVTVGVTAEGQPVELDIKEAAKGGMGPHGLCVGATGSGKSEFLRTLVLGLIATHPPDVLNLVLVDFKGGATFLGLERANHVAAVITNLAAEAHLVTRMRDALTGELTRRQELLRAAGNVANLAQYDAARIAGAAVPALPTLLIVVDEFSELLSANPEFVDLFVAIGRVGRSLGIHLLLASQRLEEGRLRGLETHLSYRICLKTFSAAESRAVLGTVDAFELPNTPGMAYLKTASDELIGFRSAFVSAPVVAPEPIAVATSVAPVRFRAAAVGRVVAADRTPRTGRETVLDTVVAGLAGRGAPAHRVWLPPLDVSPVLGAIQAQVALPEMVAAIGLVDNPFQQRRDVLIADLRGAGGHVAVVGGPRSGKSATVQTLVLALASGHGPAALQCYGLDFGGGLLTALDGLPHVGTVAARGDRELVGRVVAHVRRLVLTREQRLRRGAGAGGATVLLVVDGWSAVRQDFDGLEETITDIAAHGLAVGVHVVITASRWAELRPAFKDLVGTRIELRLGDPAESEIDRKQARVIAGRPPGHGITRDGLEFVVAQPCSTDGASVADAVEVVCARHPGPPAPVVAPLPTRVDLDSLVARSPGAVVLGLGDTGDAGELDPLTVDFGVVPHVLMLGESQCGKTAALRTLCRELLRTHDAGSAQLVVVDVRRTLLEVVVGDQLQCYAMSAATAGAALASVAVQLRQRLPGETVTQQQLRTRSWWTGPELYVIVDDYELVADAGGSTVNPLSPVIEFLPHARDVGLHLIVARRSGGAARAMFDPVLAGLRDGGCLGVMMSASAEDGVLLGAVRPAPLPPGRGTAVVRGRPDRVVQIAWTDPP